MDLWQAVQHNEIDQVKFLVHYTNVNICDVDGETLLHMAAQNGNTDMCRLLLEKGAAVDKAGDCRRNPLMSASRRNYRGLFEAYLEKDAVVELQKNIGCTPLMRAASRGYQEICELLLEKGAAVNAQDKHGWSALMWVAGLNHTTTCKCLLDHGADIDLKNKDGETALGIANKRKNEDIIKLLKEYSNKNSNMKYAQITNSNDIDKDKKIEEAQKQLNMLKAERIIEKKTEKLKQIGEHNHLEQQCSEKEKRNKEIQSKMNLLLNLIEETNNFLRKNQAQKDEFSIFLSEHNRQYQEKVKSFGDEIDRNNSIIETSKAKLELINYTVDNYELLRQKLKHLKTFFQERKYDEIINKSKRECPICFENMKSPILQCTDGHVFCETCFHKICARTKQCPFCKRMLDENNPIRNR